MKHKSLVTLILSQIVLLLGISVASGQSNNPNGVIFPEPDPVSMSSFSYQGNLQDGGVPANGLYEIKFSLWNNFTDKTYGAIDSVTLDVNVKNGMFDVDVDFGASVLYGPNGFLEIAVRPSGSVNGFTVLEPRQILRNVLYAARAHYASSLVDSSGNEVIAGSYGNVGIGTTSPEGKLHIMNFPQGANGDSNNKGTIILGPTNSSSLRLGYDTTYSWIQSHGSKPLALNPIGNNVGIGTTDPKAKLDVVGRTRSSVIEITGGSDLAEPFEVNSSNVVEPGMIVAIDAENPGELRVADVPYDRTVAGVVSGAGGISPGLILYQDGTVATGTHPVALTGRVYVWADASFGAIEPGDLLTTSATPGHAMKVTDHEAATGAILGKAMTKLEEGKGLVLLLVSLQ